jgi:large conductance mechanosensitive channel
VFKDFKAFIMRGNVLDLAVGIIIGAAFGKIVTSFVGDILTPIISLGLGKVDFSNLFVSLDGQTYATIADAKKAGAATLNFGLFANAVIDFAIVAFVIFLIVKFFNKMKNEPQPLPASTKECPECLSVIPLKAHKCAQCTSVVA